MACQTQSVPPASASSNLLLSRYKPLKRRFRLGITTKRRRDEVDFGLSLAKRIRTEGKFFRTVASKTIESDLWFLTWAREPTNFLATE